MAAKTTQSIADELRKAVPKSWFDTLSPRARKALLEIRREWHRDRLGGWKMGALHAELAQRYKFDVPTSTFRGWLKRKDS